MELAAAIVIVKACIQEAVEQDGLEIEITEDMALVGSASALDSMRLVGLCLALEDKSSDAGFDFDWTSEAALSKSKGMFRTLRSLAEEFAAQHEAQQ